MARLQNVRGDGQGGETHIGTEDARQGRRTGYMWRVLALSVIFGSLVVLAAWLWTSASFAPAGRRGGNVEVVAKRPVGPPPAGAAGPSQVVSTGGPPTP